VWAGNVGDKLDGGDEGAVADSRNCNRYITVLHVCLDLGDCRTNCFSQFDGVAIG
jgi:hypothetical protein